VRYSEGARARQLLEQALEGAGDTGVLPASIHRDLGLVLAASGSSAAPKHYWEALEIARETGDQALVAQLVALQVLVELCAGNGVRRDLIDAALGQCATGERFAMELRPRVVVSHVLRFSDDLATARSLLLAEYENEAEQGAKTDLPFLVVWLVELETWAGNFELAERYAEQGYGAAIVSGAVSALAFIRGSRALVRAWQGRESEDAALAISDAKRCDAYQPLVNAIHALGLLELAAGDPAAAHEALGPMTQLVVKRGPLDPGWWGFRMLPDDTEALIRLGRLEEAQALLAPFEERARSLGRAWAMATAARCRAILASAEGMHETAAKALRDASAAHEQMDQPHKLARTHLVGGEVTRRARLKLAARNHAQTARNIFDQLGAASWAARADDELERLGVERSGSLELTATERKVAQLVASGRTNREVAAELYMGLRTVEAHLTQAYRKLGVRSRSELARWWAERADVRL
jgi:DNA-binding CsgD family transcriptional regulator